MSSVYLQHWVGLQQAIFDGLHVLTGWACDGVVLQDLFRRLRLSGATLPRDQDALILPLGPHGTVGVVSHGIAKREGNKPLDRDFRCLE